jgi:AraC-like DNA-binding protein
MDKPHRRLSETHIVGKKTLQWIVRAEQCPALRWHHIRHVGIAAATHPYQMVRTNLSGAYLLACFGGEGRILLDGRWRVCREGMACLAPPHVLHAFHCEPNVRWSFSWVRYEHPQDQRPFISASAPVLARFDGRPLRSAIQGLFDELNAAADPVAIQHWTELIQRYAMRFAQPWHSHDRLANLWETVDSQLAENWTAEQLAKLAGCSAEHLRRLCHQHLGRAPMHQVTYLRMRRAAKLLESSEHKIQTIAELVGYQNPFAFSKAFKRSIGWRPSDYRGRSGAKELRPPVG